MLQHTISMRTDWLKLHETGLCPSLPPLGLPLSTPASLISCNRLPLEPLPLCLNSPQQHSYLFMTMDLTDPATQRVLLSNMFNKMRIRFCCRFCCQLFNNVQQQNAFNRYSALASIFVLGCGSVWVDARWLRDCEACTHKTQLVRRTCRLTTIRGMCSRHCYRN